MLSETYETPGALVLNLAIPAGTVEIDTAAGEVTRVELEALTDSARELLAHTRMELRERGSAHEVVVDIPSTRSGFFISFGRGPDFRLHVTCPPGAELDVETKSADVRGRGVFGSSEIKTASGDINLGEIQGDARIKTASGDVSLDEVHGTTHVQTASGDLALQRARGDVTGQLVSGDVWIRDALRSVTLKTVSGDMRVEAVIEGVADLTAISGDILVGVRRGSRVYVDCNTISGSTSSELELADAPAATAEAGGEAGPQVELRAKTVSGDIGVVRAAAPAPLPRA
jgi:Putative adhesin